MRSLLVGCVVVAFGIGLSAGMLHGIKFQSRMIEGPTRSSATATPDLWFTNQRVDHFDNTNTGTWNQRYLVNSTYWLGDGYPIIVNLGGEGTMGYTSVTGRFIFNTWAKQLSALIVSVEHRYYGQSMPTSDMSNANMPLLSSEQAIADYAVFINYIKTTYNAPHSEVLTAGGSYSGALSAWIRQKYPQIINTAYATSAPVFAKEDFTEYLEIVGAGLGTQCANAVKQGTLYYESLLQTPAGLEQIQKDFQTCTAIETENDKIVFMEYLADTISGFVQYNNDNNGYFPTNITGVCDMLLADDITVTYPQFILWYNDIFGEPCTPVSYADMVAELSITDPLAADPASRSWYWQTCSEFGYFQTGESSNQPFSSMISLQYFLDICYDVYGVSNTVVEMAIESTNNLYGGLNVGSSEIVFPNGSVDPWHALGLTQTTDPELPTVYIQGTAHCADMYAASPNDIPSLTTARSQVFSYITYWLN